MFYIGSVGSHNGIQLPDDAESVGFPYVLHRIRRSPRWDPTCESTCYLNLLHRIRRIPAWDPSRRWRWGPMLSPITRTCQVWKPWPESGNPAPKPRGSKSKGFNKGLNTKVLGLGVLAGICKFVGNVQAQARPANP